MGFLQNIPSFLVAIIVLVTIHEFGHFYVARRCGVRVLRFALGFGKVIWSRVDCHGTEFAICVLPFGGYVKMLDEREEPVAPELLSQAFTRKSVWQRMAIVVAGPVANFILALFLFWVLLLQGEHGAIPIVAKVKPDSIAALAGVKVGQEIIAVDNVLTPTEQAVGKQLINRLGESGELILKVRSETTGADSEIRVPLDHWLQTVKDPDPIAGLGIDLVPLKPLIGEVLANSPADKAGIKVGDLITQVDDIPTPDWRDFQSYVREHIGVSLLVKVDRKTSTGNNEILTFHVVPESFTDKAVSYGRIGVGSQPLDANMFRAYQYSVGQAAAESVKKVGEMTGFVFLSVKKLILGEISTKNLSGPISIAKVAGSSAQNGLKSFVGFLAMLSVFLGVFNLLPIPVLDGGHLAYLLVEAVRGKPVSEQIQVIGFQLGLFLVLSLSVLATYNDIMRF